MIDWVSAIVTVQGANLVDGGSIIVVGKDGTIERENVRPFVVEGSYSDKVSLKWLSAESQHGNIHTVSYYISGNPSKWFQGHNVFGTSNHLLIRDFIRDVHRVSGIGGNLFLHDIRLTRVDTTKSFQLDSLADVAAWLGAAAPYIRGRRQDVSVYEKSGTLYIGQRSKKKSIKFYAKGPELRRRGRPESVSESDYKILSSFADRCLRVEVCMRGPELKKLCIENLSSWRPDTADRAWGVVMAGVQLPAQVELPQGTRDDLPRRLRAPYELWLSGANVRQLLSRATWFRARAGLLEYGVDIEKPPRDVKRSNVVPLLRVLQASEAVVPLELRRLEYRPRLDVM